MSRLRRPIGGLAGGALLIASLVLFGRRVGPVPPLGPLLDPARGIWTVARQDDHPPASARIPGLTAPVEVAYDDRGVPHIFAKSEADAARALGFVVARDRLFQLDVQTLAGAGRLTEIAGAPALRLDREVRQLGLPWSAERKLAALPEGSPDRVALDAFADGVNAWIDGMGRGDLPLEYHLLGRRPPHWQPINSLHLLSQMGRILAYSNLEEAKAGLADRVGWAATDALLPANSPIQEPIQPNGARGPRKDFVTVPPPAAGDTASVSELSPPPPEYGSNNWVVSPGRTAHGYALLAGDPHLDLSLPSIWYEAQVAVADSFDAYGVTIPGAASLIIGFNRNLAWTVTNTEADVADRYIEEVDDSLHPARYRLDGSWRPLEVRSEEYRGRDGKLIAVDTLRLTHRGPLTADRGRWVSLRWTVLDPSSDLGGFRRLMHAQSVQEGLEAMAGYGAPAQNLALADRAGNIAIRSTGHFPNRPGDGRGDRYQDGTKSSSDWTGFRPLDQYPQATNPSRGFLSSNNQQPIDPKVDPRYFGADWYPPWRAIRINELLRRNDRVTPDDMRLYQVDPGSARADWLLPWFLGAGGAAAPPAPPPGDPLGQALGLLGKWDGRYNRGNQGAILFEYAVDELNRRLWDELWVPTRGEGDPPLPGMAVVAELLEQPDNPWWDERATTAVVEHRDEVLRESLRAAYLRAVRDFGDPSAGGWRWGAVHHANIYHLLRIPALSALDLSVDGGPSTLSPSQGSGTFGASWRMVVELGPEVHGWGIYPGGQSGNPVSRRYLDHLSKWLGGELDTLQFPHSADALGPHRVATLRLEPAR